LGGRERGELFSLTGEGGNAREGGREGRRGGLKENNLPAQPPVSFSPSGDDASDLAACLLIVRAIDVESVGLLVMLLLLLLLEEEGGDEEEEGEGRTKKEAARHGNSKRRSARRRAMTACCECPCARREGGRAWLGLLEGGEGGRQEGFCRFFYVPVLLLLLLLHLLLCPPPRLGFPTLSVYMCVWCIKVSVLLVLSRVGL